MKQGRHGNRQKYPTFVYHGLDKGAGQLLKQSRMLSKVSWSKQRLKKALLKRIKTLETDWVEMVRSKIVISIDPSIGKSIENQTSLPKTEAREEHAIGHGPKTTEQDGDRFVISVARLALSYARFIGVAWIMTSLQVRSDRIFLLRNIASPVWRKAAPFWYWEQQLPDLLLDNLAHIAWVHRLPVEAADWALNSFLVIGFLAAILNRRGVKEATMFAQIMTIAYGFRLLSMPVTAIPPSDPRCPIIVHEGDLGFQEYLLHGVLTMVGKERTCTDKLFSGHTAVACTVLYLYLKASGRRLVQAYATLHFVAILFLILACRNHYTVDIVLGLVITGLTLVLYNQFYNRSVAKNEQWTRYKQLAGDELV